MKRLALALTCIALLAGDVLAQQRLDASRLRPITAPVKNAGTVDVTTGKWTRPGQAGNQQKAAAIKTIFNNTCTWITQGYYAGFSACDDNYDEGRVPSPSDPGSPATADASNVMESFQVSYCTFVGPALPSGYDMDVAFWDKLNGDCVGGIPPTPPHASVTATAYFALEGLGLPGSTALGFQACWLVTLDVSNTGWVMASDGEGTFDNDPPNDKFIWLQRQNEALTILAANPDGFLISGEPATGGFGACSYNIACGTDAVFGGTCGTGLDAFDASWINVDAIGVGSSVTIPPTTQACPFSAAQSGFGTNCYFFGGYPTDAFASYWLVLKSEAAGIFTLNSASSNTVSASFGSPMPGGISLPMSSLTGEIMQIRLSYERGGGGGVGNPYCTARITSCGSSPTINASFAPISAANGGSYPITLSGVPDAPAGGPAVLIHTPNGPHASPPALSFGLLCIATPFFRGPAVGAPAPGGPGACDGIYTWDFGTYITNLNTPAAKAAVGIVAGNTIDIQGWARDPANGSNAPFGTANFSNAFVTLVSGSPLLPPVVTGFNPSSGIEGTVLTVDGSDFGTTPSDLKVLVAGGIGFADVSSSTGTLITSTVFAVGATGSGPITVVRGNGTTFANQNLNLGGINSAASQVRAILQGLGSNEAKGEFLVFEFLIDFTGVPTAQQRAQHLASYINTNLNAQGVSASVSVSSVRISMAGSTYGSIVVKGS